MNGREFLTCAAFASFFAAGVASAAVDASDLWLYADFDRPLMIDGRILETAMKEGHPCDGKFGTAGYAFVSAKARCDNLFIAISDRDRLESYPFESGSFSCFYRLPEGVESAPSAPLFGYGGYWTYHWSWTGSKFSCDNKTVWTSSAIDLSAAFRPSRDWAHFCATWTAERLCCYTNGVLVASKDSPTRADMRDVADACLRIGAYGYGSAAANVEADEVAIFRRALSADEVAALSASSSPVGPPADLVLPGHVDFPIFWRNQRDAAFRMKVWSPAAETVSAVLTVGGLVVYSGAAELTAGTCLLKLPLDPSRFAPGEYGYTLVCTRADGADVLSDAGRIEIRGRVEPDAFRLMSWGGASKLSAENFRTFGLNSYNVAAGTADREVRDYLRHDIFINYRLENSTAWDAQDFDGAAIAAAARATLAAGEGLHLWQSTLVNSEVYGEDVSVLTNDQRLYERAYAGLGHAPDTRTLHAPEVLDYAQKGIAPYRGVMPDDDTTLRTIRWYEHAGVPVYAVNEADERAIHALSPRNVVWSEPSPDPWGLDMVSDWVYNYRAETCLGTLRRQCAFASSHRRLNQPTLAMGYWHTLIPRGVHPVSGEAVTPAQSCDEVIVKSWMAIGAVRADHLSYFSASTWQEGAAGAAAYRRDPSAAVATVGEEDAIERYGAFVRAKLRPAAELLRGIDNVCAKVALVWLDEATRAGAHNYNRLHYRNQVCDALSRQPWAFDYVSERECTAEVLSRYDYLVMPMFTVVTESHDAAIRSLPPTVKKVMDPYATVSYPNATVLTNMAYKNSTRLLHFNFQYVDAPLGEYFADKSDALRRAQAAWSEEDGTNAYTFVKEHRGVTYATVVNNLRRDGGVPMTDFVTNDWYRPACAPQRITTHLNIPAGGCAYEFNADGRTAAAVEALDYAAAEGRVFCIYPRPLSRLSVRIAEPRVGAAETLATVEIADAEGPAPGRQVVEVTVTRPDGTPTDESGLYPVEGGVRTIPIRFTEAERATAAEGGWTVSVRELTSGLTGSATSAAAHVCTWTGEVSSDWSDAANWSGGVPAAGATVRVSGAVTLTNATPRLAALELGDGAAVSTLTLAGWRTRLAADVVVLRDKATVTCAPCDSANGVTNRVWIACDTLTVAAGAKIDVSGKGFEGVLSATSSSLAGRGPGGGTAYGAGSHGGFGGWGWGATSADGFNALPYDDAADPALPGSSGSSANKYGTSGAGGGVVRVEATGRVTVDGAIAADAPMVTTLQSAAGAGGAVSISCSAVAGAGRISADGGSSYLGANLRGAPGGGGRIALRYDAAVQRADEAADLTVSAAPGRMGLNSAAGLCPATEQDAFYTNCTPAGAGTLWFTDEKLLVGLGSKLTGVLANVPDELTFDSLVLTAGQVMIPNEGLALNVKGDLTLSSPDAYLELGGVCPTNRIGSVTYFGGRKSVRLNVGGDLRVLSGARLDVRAAMTNGVEAFGAVVTVGGTLQIGDGAKVCPESDPCNLGSVAFDVGSLVVDEGGWLCADRRGGAGGHEASKLSTLLVKQAEGEGPGYGVSVYALKYGTKTFNRTGAGGGYGGRGMFNEIQTGKDVSGRSYGDACLPLLPGSGGGTRSDGWDRTGGHGGGLVYVTAKNAITVNGKVSADGMESISSQSGAGSGGGICLRAASFSAGATAVLTADGGAAYNGRQSGAGGGGRIAVHTSRPAPASGVVMKTVRSADRPTRSMQWIRVAADATFSARGGTVTYAYEDDWPYGTSAEDGTVRFEEVHSAGIVFMVN